MRVKYKLKQLIPMLAIAGATILPASCKKTTPEEKPVPHHNTTYVWGKHYLDEVWPTDNITKSVDSTSVDIVFLENDGSSWDGSSVALVLKYVEKITNDVKSKNKYKIRGAGTLNNVYISDDQDVQDSVTLAKMNFKFGKVLYPQKSR